MVYKGGPRKRNRLVLGTQRQNGDDQEEIRRRGEQQAEAMGMGGKTDEEQTTMSRGKGDYVSANGETGWELINGEYLCLVWGPQYGNRIRH